jgi:hypothetical protein
VCRHVAREGLPILYAERTAPVSPEDSGWQFVCNSGRVEDGSQAQVWSLTDVLRREPGLQTFVASPVGTRVYRRDASTPWEEDRSTVH